MNKNISKTLKTFTPISLDQLNSSVSFLDRIDVKYLIHESDLAGILEKFQEHFYILEIVGHSIFTYDNIYMDSKNLSFYSQHQNQQDNRIKVRSRLYTESHYSFFECKQKSGQTTRKFRFQQDELKHGLLYNELLSFYNGVYQTLHSNEPKDLIFPAVKTKYHRITLCSKNNDERVTIDFNLQFEDLRPIEKKGKGKKDIYTQASNIYEVPSLVMIESKSMNTNCISHEIMKSLGFATAKACSKYCLAQYYFKKVKEWSTFQDTINTIEKITRQEIVQKKQALSQELAHTILPGYQIQEVR